MKKHILFYIAFFFALPAHAQWSLGIQVGKTKAWHNNTYYYHSGGDDTSLPTINGVNLTVPLYYKFNKYFQLGIEPGVAQRGTESSPGYFFFDDFILPTNTAFSSRQSLYTTFLQLPVLAMVNAPIAKDKFSFYVKGGLGPSRLVSAERGNNFFSSNGDVLLEEIDLEEGAIYKWDFGLYSGLGLQMKLGKGQVLLGFEQYFGFKAVEYYDYSKSRSYGFSLGYSIGIN